MPAATASAAPCSRIDDAGGRPMCFPSRLARSMPARVRSMSLARSCSAAHAKTETSRERAGPLGRRAGRRFFGRSLEPRFALAQHGREHVAAGAKCGEDEPTHGPLLRLGRPRRRGPQRCNRATQRARRRGGSPARAGSRPSRGAGRRDDPRARTGRRPPCTSGGPRTDARRRARHRGRTSPSGRRDGPSPSGQRGTERDRQCCRRRPRRRRCRDDTRREQDRREDKNDSALWALAPPRGFSRASRLFERDG